MQFINLILSDVYHKCVPQQYRLDWLSELNQSTHFSAFSSCLNSPASSFYSHMFRKMPSLQRRRPTRTRSLSWRIPNWRMSFSDLPNQGFSESANRLSFRTRRVNRHDKSFGVLCRRHTNRQVAMWWNRNRRCIFLLMRSSTIPTTQ